MSERKKILWLVSWYPGRHDMFDGDFIQRHARAAAIFHDIHVIFVKESEMDTAVEEEWNYVTGLTEQLVYFKKPSGWFNRVRSNLSWKSIFQKAIDKYILKNGKPDLVHVHVPWKSGLLALWTRKKYGLNFLVTEHWGIYNKTTPGNFFSLPVFAQQLLRKIYLEARSITTVSKYLASGVGSVTGRQVDRIIPNVVDTTLFFHKEEKYSRFTFIHVSNMVPLKNAGSILEAFQKLAGHHPGHELQLVMVGNRNDQFVKQAADLGLLNVSVFFRGEIPYTEVAEEMKRSHCLVIFSDSETFSCVTAEALCCGLPVIAANVGALPEMVSNYNGRLVSPGNIDDLVNAMEEVWKNFASFDSRQIAMDHASRFGYPAIAAQFDSFYKDIKE